MKLNVEGESTLSGVVDAVEFLRSANLGNRGLPGKCVVIVGGGNVAVDAARTALRLGCEKVTIVYRRTRGEMPAFAEEIDAALEEGVDLDYLTAPVGIVGSNGKVTGMKCIRTELGPPDESGRRRPVPVKGSEFVIQCDAVIPAIGQVAETQYLVDAGLEATRRSTLVVRGQTMQTTAPDVFAAGDVVSGPATVIEAVASGRRAAEAIFMFITGADLDGALPLSPNQTDAHPNGERSRGVSGGATGCCRHTGVRGRPG